MLQDFRFASRLLRRNPGYAVAAVLTIALGVALNGAVFALVRSVLLRPLPFRDPDRVVVLWQPRDRGAATLTYDDSDAPQTAGAFIDWRANQQSFQGLAAVELWKDNLESRFDLVASDHTERLRGAFATPGFFTLLGVEASLGRVFSEQDPLAVQSQEAVISDGLWRRLYGADSAVLGRTIRVLGGRPRTSMNFTIIGVLPQEFRYSYPEETELWTPLTAARLASEPRPALLYQIVGRLKPGITPAQAGAELSAIEQRVAGANPRESWRARFRVVATPFRERLTRASRPLLTTLSAVAGLVLLIACVNVANLVLARIVMRRREFAVRAALGAARARLLQQVLVETALLGILGGIVGVAVLGIAMPLWRTLVPSALPRGDELRLDTPILVVSAGVVMLAALIGTLAALVVGATQQPVEILKENTTVSVGGRRAAAWRKTVCGAQLAVVFILVASGGLLLKSFWRVTHVDLGYDGRQVLTMEMRVLGPKARSDENMAQFQRSVLDEIRRIPGVTDAAMTSAVPLRGTDWRRTYDVQTSGPDGLRRLAANERQVSPEYFSLLRIPLLNGRLFTSADNATAPRVVVVSESMAHAVAPTGSAIGRRLDLDGGAEIVGIVGDVRARSITEPPRPAVYLPRDQQPSELMCLVIRTALGQRQSIVAAARSAIRKLDPEQPIERITTLDAIANESIADQRFYAAVTGVFSSVALLLATIGLAGIVSRSVSERVREIAVRGALGADHRQLRRMIVSQALYPVALGLAVGVMIAAWVTRWLQAELYQVAPRDATTFGGTAVVLALVSTVAAYLPARRGTRIDPAEALRAE